MNAHCKLIILESIVIVADSPFLLDTLIVWTDLSGTDMALSFQEAEGCASIWYIALPANQLLNNKIQG